MAYLSGSWYTRPPEPVGWCAIAPREYYKPLYGDEAKERAWSIICFFVRRPFRGMGIPRMLMKSACKYARDNGAEYVEAYPVDMGAPSYRFMGAKPNFESDGFQFVKKVGKWRNAMLLKLE